MGISSSCHLDRRTHEMSLSCVTKALHVRPHIRQLSPHFARLRHRILTLCPAGRDSWCEGLGPRSGVAARKCMARGDDHPQLPHAKRRDGTSPGPGAYATGDSAVMGQKGATFAATDERKGVHAALDLAVGRLKTLEWRIGFIRRGLRDPDA